MKPAINYWNSNLSVINEELFIKAVKQAQVDAYNQALDDAVLNAEIKEIEYNNPYSENDGNITRIIDKQSILKLKK